MQVSSVAELKRAISEKPNSIEIVDAGLAKKIVLLKKAKAPVIAALIAAMGVSGFMWWNPIGASAGVSLGFVAMTSEGALAAAIVFFVSAMGVGLVWALYKEWDIDVEATQEKSEKGATKQSIHLKLRPKRS